MQRDVYYDNLKYVLITLVVVGHFALTYLHGADSRPVTVFKDWIWIFHMPAFLFVSGMFAKGLYKPGRGLKVDSICFYLVMYLLFYCAVTAVMAIYEDPSFDPFIVYRIPWYFLALALLGATIPVAYQLRPGWRLVVPASVAVAVAAGFSTGFTSFLSLGRIINFAPFYYAGYFMDRGAYKGAVAKVQANPFLSSACVVLLGAVFISLWTAPKEYVQALNNLSMAYSSYADCGDLPVAVIAAMRVAWFPLAAAMTFAVSALVPMGKTFFSEPGQRTLQVYLLHPALYLPLRGLDIIPDYVSPVLPHTGTVILLAAALLTYVLAYPKFPARWLGNLQRSIRLDRND